MSVTTRVFLEPGRMPSPADWARAIRTHGFEMDLDTDFDVVTFTGFLPCLHEGQPAGFEYYFTADANLEDDVRRAAGSKRTLEVCFVTHSDMRELVTALIASAVLAAMTDGVVWSDEGGESMLTAAALDLARETEGEVSRPD